MSFRYYLLPDAGSGPLSGFNDAYINVFNGDDYVNGDYSDPLKENSWELWQANRTGSALVVTKFRLGFRLQEAATWRGTLFIDNIQVH
ncbi:MAG: hypothetical protein RJA70_3479 [Pseudomonadota bacterium]|jgi:hypothetical protein